MVGAAAVAGSVVTVCAVAVAVAAAGFEPQASAAFMVLVAAMTSAVIKLAASIIARVCSGSLCAMGAGAAVVSVGEGGLSAHTGHRL